MVDDTSDDNEALADLIFAEVGQNYRGISTGAQMEYTFEAYGDELTKEQVKQYVTEVCNKYGFTVKWESIDDHPEFADILNM